MRSFADFLIIIMISYSGNRKQEAWVIDTCVYTNDPVFMAEIGQALQEARYECMLLK